MGKLSGLVCGAVSFNLSLFQKLDAQWVVHGDQAGRYLNVESFNLEQHASRVNNRSLVIDYQDTAAANIGYYGRLRNML